MKKTALAALERVTEKWTTKYPNSMKRWKDNWDAIAPIFKFSAAVRKVIYTTNAIESLILPIGSLIARGAYFPVIQPILKALYLAAFEATRKLDIYDSELGSGIWRIEFYVRRKAARVILRMAKNRRKNRLLLICLFAAVIYKVRDCRIREYPKVCVNLQTDVR